MDLIDWLKETQAAYDVQPKKDPGEVVTQTRFGSFIRIAERCDLVALLPQRPIQILHVGPGGESERGFVPYELYELAAYLQFNEVEYDLTVVDVVPGVIDSVLELRVLWRTYTDLMLNPHEEFDDVVWPMYWKMLGKDAPFTRGNQQIFYAPIPETLATKLDAGEVDTHIGDIARAELPRDAFDFVVSRNVLYQLGDSGKKLAYWRISEAMRQGAYLWTNYGLMVSWSLVNEDRQHELSQQPWFQDLGLKKGPVLVDYKGVPLEYMYVKEGV